MDTHSKDTRLPRRQFLANLLFAGGVLTLTGLQSAQAAEHPTDGWTLPDLNGPTPSPSPSPRPRLPGRPVPPKPPLAGKPIPPNPRGRVVQPPDGDYCPPKPGEVVAPPPPPRR